MRDVLKNIFKRKKRYTELDPDEVFLDARNVSKFNKYQCEGRLERPIPLSSFVFLIVIFILTGLIFSGKIWTLQIQKGQMYAEMSENNTVREQVIFSERGLVYDRNKMLLAWNKDNPDDPDFAKRAYADQNGIGNLLGYVKYPAKDSSGFYYQTEYKGIAGIESIFNRELSGNNGLKVVQTDVSGKKVSESTIDPATSGKNVTLTVDARLQNAMYDFIETTAHEYDYHGGAAVMMDLHTGEITALVNYPEYKSNILTDGNDVETIEGYATDVGNPYMNRVVTGLYTPGSIMKPFIATGVLEEGIIDPKKKILSTGVLKLQSPYDPEQYELFRDWQPQGWVDMRDALAVSSDIYFYEVGGGYEDQPGLGITKLGQYVEKFGFGKAPGTIYKSEEAKGVVPSPEWKRKNFKDGIWRVGDTYHTSIGQYGFLVTPLQVVKALSGIATGKMVTPVMVKGEQGHVEPLSGISDETLKIVQEGMHLGIKGSIGTVKALDVPYIDAAAKTGTAELGLNKTAVNMWTEIYFPYDHPRYGLVVLLEDGPYDNEVGSVYTVRKIFDWMNENTPEYFADTDNN